MRVEDTYELNPFVMRRTCFDMWEPCINVDFSRFFAALPFVIPEIDELESLNCQRLDLNWSLPSPPDFRWRNESSRNKISTQDLSEIVRSQDVSSLIRELRSRPRIQMAIKENDEIPVVNYPIRTVMSCESFFRCSCTTLLPRNGLLPSLCNIAVLTLFSPATISSRYEFPTAGSLSRFQRCSPSRSSLQQVFLLRQLFRQ